MRIGTTQLIPRNLGNKEWHLERMISHIRKGREVGLDLLCFPEYELTGFVLEDLSVEKMKGLSEPSNGPSFEKVKSFLKGSNMAVGYGFTERDGAVLYNSYIVLDQSGMKHLYRKTHLCGFGVGLHEKNFLRHGTELSTFTLNGVVIGVVICFDGFHAETMKVLGLKGAQVILWPLAGFGDGNHLTTKTAQIRAADNNAFVVVSATTGNYKNYHFDSGAGIYHPRSMFDGPRALLKVDEEGMVWTEIGTDELGKAGFKRGWTYPDRRPELYQSIGEKSLEE